MKRYLTLLLLITLVALSGCNTGESAAADPDQPAAAEEESPGTEASAAGADDSEEEILQPLWEWEYGSPESQGMDGGLLTALHDSLAGTETYSVLTVRNGVVVDEFYNEGCDETSVFRLNSCSKSFTSALIGIAIDEGLISGVDVSIAEYFPDLAGTDKEEITIRHLLEHTSGIEWYEWNSGSTFWDWRQSDSWVEYVLEQPVVTTPGAAFNYTTGGPHLLAAILQQATGMSAYDYAKEHIFAPLGMQSVVWSADPEGVTDGGNGVAMTARDAAKFGQLFLNGGNWEGEQLISEEWVALSTSQQSSGIGSSGVYGYQWWIQTFGGYHTYYAMGHAGQFIFVVPELELVTVVTSSMDQDTYTPRAYLTDYIFPACS